MKAAIVYDRVNKWGGAERVLLALHRIFPKAVLFTSVYDPKKAPWAKVFPEVHTSFLQKFALARNNHEFLAPLMPFAFKSFDFSEFDLVISVTSEFAKNIRTSGKTIHICYCLTPTRYLWSHRDLYFRNRLLRFFAWPAVWFLKILDLRSSKNPDKMIAISTEVKKRIKKYYGRNSEIVFPPVKISLAGPSNPKYYLLVSRLDYGYKKVDLAIEAFNKLNYPLWIVGTGREEGRLRKLAGKNIKFTGRVAEKDLKNIYKNAKALIMPQEEDFGIVAVEAQGLGVPVIAFGRGGASDTVINDKTGILFPNQSVESLCGAVLQFETMRFKRDNLQKNAKRFSDEKFRSEFVKIIQNARK